MDLTITISNGKIETTIFEKEQNLYLYLPPHSSHPKGVKTGLVLGKVLRIRRLCSKKCDADRKIREFFLQLLARGHKRQDLALLFIRAEENAEAYLSRSPEDHAARKSKTEEEARQLLFFHLQFHPEDPLASEIQSLWREYVSHPANEPPLPQMRNRDGEQCNLDKLVIAYSRPLNLRNQFSVRNIHGRGRDVSEYLVG